MTRYLLRRPSGGFVGRLSDWTLSRHQAHSWVDPHNAALAARRWHQIHGEELRVEAITTIPAGNGMSTWVA
jgi:hypothetical protein